MKNLCSNFITVAFARRSTVVASLFLLSGVYSIAQIRRTEAPDHMPSLAHGYSTAGLILEYERAICALDRGIRKQWTTREQYLSAFEKTNDYGTAGETLAAEKENVHRLLEAWLPTQNGIWDEHFPYYIIVQQRLAFLTNAVTFFS
jgi:hypothetical protein